MQTQLIDAKTVAKMLLCSGKTLDSLIAAGEAPPFLRFGRVRRWRVEDVNAWIECRIKAETSVNVDKGNGFIEKI
ncbi:hypothetical protein WG78_14510 [Amantichitinum ursilacus]|uniref:Helix-turn-helix domain-containing protein n=2 Tax=Amantichitinum ursilacus TaxID=857265 RepID=A0A0N0GN29_9NEIS|nr:hypothetical protein WG78_14510 [Amantichitinum ursilacus]